MTTPQHSSTPGSGLGAAAPLELSLQQELLRSFRRRLIEDSRLVLVGHSLLIVAGVWAMLGDGIADRLFWWAGVLLVVTVIRALWQYNLDRAKVSDRTLVWSVRVLVTAQGLAWGLGTALLIPWVSPGDLAIVLVAMAGILASAASTLEAEPTTLRLYLVAVLGPVVFGLASGAGEHDRLMAMIITVYATVVVLLHRRAHRALVAATRAATLLASTHREVRSERAYFEALLRSAPLAVAVLDDFKRVRFVNELFQQIFGYAPAELVGKDLADLLVPADQVAEHEHLNGSLRQGRVVSADVVRIAKDGHEVTVRISAAAIDDPEASGTVVMYEDISGQRAVQAALEERERRLRRLMDANLVGIAYWESDGAITDANDEYLRITGYDRSDLEAGRVNFRSMAAPEMAALAQGVAVPSWESDVIRKDGTETPALLAVAPVNNARDQGICFVVDISSRREVERRLTRKTALLEAQVNSSLDGILVVDPAGQTVLTNHQMATMWGMPEEIANAVDDAIRLAYVVAHTKHPETFLAGVERLYADPDATSRDEIELVTGETLDRHSAPVVGPGGEHYGRIWTFRDISPAKQAARTLEEARALAEQTSENRSMFLANMSHEIRTPMNAVLGMLELVLDSELTAEQRHYLALASTSAESLLGILNDVLDYSKIGAGRIDLEEIIFDLPKVVHGTAALLAARAAERGIELVIDVDPVTPDVVRGDPTRLRQVLTNLIGNAVKFTERGEVVVVVRPQAMEDGRPGVAVAVRDTGIGMTPDQREQLFQAFRQGDGSTNRRFGGTGLGLAISGHLIELMGGRITVTSEPGQGSEFTVELPFAAVPDVAPVPPFDVEALSEQVIIVVDDNAVNRHLLDRMLSAVGARVIEAETAAEALTHLRRVRAAGIHRVLCILDGQMPDVDGFELARQIRADTLLVETPLVMLTSSGRRGDAARCRELKVPAYLTKPVSQGDLIETVAAVLNGLDPIAGPGALLTRQRLVEARTSLSLLLAEDNPVNQLVAVTMLRKRGHRVDLVVNGAEAVAAVQRVRYDLVLMDIQMPELDGYGATAQIRATEAGRDLPIIALTAHAYGEERERCLKAGMNGFVTKPFKGAELFAAVEGTPRRPPRVSGSVVAPSVPDVSHVVDLTGFQSQLRAAGVESALGGILDVFLEETPARAETLCRALLEGSATEVGAAAHALKGSVAAIGASGLAALLSGIEVAGNGDTLEDRAHLADQVRIGVAEVLGETGAFRARTD